MATDLKPPGGRHAGEELVDALPCGVVSFDDTGHVLFTNATLRSWLGYDEGELEGHHVERMLTIAGKIFYQTHFFPMLRLHGRVQEVFLLLRDKSGADIGALANAVRGARGGEPVIDCVLVEVQERRRYEEELLRARQTAERANDELASRSEALENALAQLREQTMEMETQAERLQEQAAELEAQQEELQAAYDRLVIQRDEVERARAAADDANRAKSQFLSTMSHELRTPLNAIGGYVQLLEMGVHGPITDAQRHALDRIARSHRHLLRLVNDVLNLARIEAGRVDYRLEETDLERMMAEVLPMIEPQLDEAGLVLESRPTPGLCAIADREKAQQILLNVLTNAVKFTPRGGRVSVRTRRADDGGAVLVEVVDTGIGIAAEELDRVFEPFVQVHTGPSRRAEGTGLGLAISRDLARGMGGDLMAESVVGVGSTFTLRLPAG